MLDCPTSSVLTIPHTSLLLSAHINHHAPFVLLQNECSKLPKKSTWKPSVNVLLLHCSDCLELAAGWPESFSLPPNAFLPPILLTDLYMPTATCFIFVCVCACVCVCVRACVCVRVSWGRGWWLGEMELWVGSNIMIHFLYILLFLIWHMYLYIIHC